MSEETPDLPMNEAQWRRMMQESDARSAKFGELLETLIDHPDRDEIINREMGWDRPPKNDEGDDSSGPFDDDEN